MLAFAGAQHVVVMDVKKKEQYVSNWLHLAVYIQQNRKNFDTVGIFEIHPSVQIVFTVQIYHIFCFASKFQKSV